MKQQVSPFGFTSSEKRGAELPPMQLDGYGKWLNTTSRCSIVMSMHCGANVNCVGFNERFDLLLEEKVSYRRPKPIK